MPEQLEAIVEETVFRNEENGYSVVEVRTGRASITAVGILLQSAYWSFLPCVPC